MKLKDTIDLYAAEVSEDMGRHPEAGAFKQAAQQKGVTHYQAPSGAGVAVRAIGKNARAKYYPPIAAPGGKIGLQKSKFPKKAKPGVSLGKFTSRKSFQGPQKVVQKHLSDKFGINHHFEKETGRGEV